MFQCCLFIIRSKLTQAAWLALMSRKEVVEYVTCDPVMAHLHGDDTSPSLPLGKRRHPFEWEPDLGGAGRFWATVPPSSACLAKSTLNDNLYLCLQPKLGFFFFLTMLWTPKLRHFLLPGTFFLYPLSLMKFANFSALSFHVTSSKKGQCQNSPLCGLQVFVWSQASWRLCFLCLLPGLACKESFEGISWGIRNSILCKMFPLSFLSQAGLVVLQD